MRFLRRLALPSRAPFRRHAAPEPSSFAPRLALLSVLVCAACDGAPEVPPPPDPDLARECSGPGIDAGARPDGGRAGGCAANEICIEGRCYARCTAPTDCGPNETCSASGVCTTGTRPDAGPPPDSGPPGPCDGVDCTPQVCHPQTGLCVDCSEDTVTAAPGTPGACPSSGPICDIANGSCVGFAPAVCAGCNSDSDCAATDGSFTGTCVLRETMGVREQVCIPPCDGTGMCAGGLECRTVRNLSNDMDVTGCLPPIEMPCTNWLSRGRTCFADADCAPRGATTAVYVGACEGEVIATEDGGTSTPGTCLQPCGATDDCANAAGGEECLGEGIELFCRIPPPPP